MPAQKPSQKSTKSQETTKKLHRLLSILRMLDNRKFCTAQTLSQQFATTDRNIYRDLSALNASGFTITFDKEVGTYRFADPDFTLRDLNLNKEELSVLLVGKQVLQSLGKPFDKSYQSLFKKVHKDTGIKTQESVKRIEESQNFFIDIAPDFNMADYFKPGWHMIRYGEPVEVVLKFTEYYARWIKRRKWHPTQVIEEQEDGSIILKVRIEGTRDVARLHQ